MTCKTNCPHCKTELPIEIFGTKVTCPGCEKTLLAGDVYSRIVGYLRPVSSWADHKKQEMADRVPFDIFSDQPQKPRKRQDLDTQILYVLSLNPDDALSIGELADCLGMSQNERNDYPHRLYTALKRLETRGLIFRSSKAAAITEKGMDWLDQFEKQI